MRRENSLLVHRQNTWSCRLSSSCQTRLSCEDSEGLSCHWLFLFLQTVAKLGTETWKEMMTEVSLRHFWHDSHFHNPLSSASYQPFSHISPDLCGGSVWEETSAGAGLLLTKTGFPVQAPKWLQGHLCCHRRGGVGTKRRRKGISLFNQALPKRKYHKTIHFVLFSTKSTIKLKFF